MTPLPDPQTKGRQTAGDGCDGTGTCLLYVHFPADAEATRTALARMQTLFLAIGLAKETQYDVVIALTEAINNIIEHALGDNPLGCVGLSCYRRNGELLVRLQDNGKAMPGLSAPMGQSVDFNRPMADLPEGGFGWFLIRQLTSDVQYHRERNINHLDLRFEIPHPK